ncbi:MAG: ABC transporter permease [Acidobacteriota bacterium]|nr:ABC transporter permease [Acidobacteriota bacterium]
MRAIDELLQDTHLAIRMLRKSPVFAVVIVAMLSVGIGVNTAVFGVVNAILFRPLPVKDGARLQVIATYRAKTPALSPVSFPDLQDYRAATRDVFDDIAGYSVGFMGLAYQGRAPARVLVSWVTGNYFSLLGIQPALGRLIREDEASPGPSAPVAVLGYSTWVRRFGGDPAVIGHKVMLNGRPCTVVGVVAEEFTGTFAFSQPEIYLPVNWMSRSVLEDRSARNLHTLAPLRPGIGMQRAQSAADVVAERLRREHPADDGAIRLKVVPERLARPEEDNARSNGIGAAAMLMLVELVLLAAILNVANLLLALVTGRRREFAIRLAMGAASGRIIRQLLTEFAVLAALGGLAGFGLALRVWQTLATVRLPGDLPLRIDFHPDGRVLAYGAAATAFTALMAGLVGGRGEPRRNVHGALHEGGAAVASSGWRWRKALLVLQLAISLVLLIAGGMFLRSLRQAQRANFGFKPEGVLNLEMNVAYLGYSPSLGRAFFDEVERRVRNVPGVEKAAVASSVPMGYMRSSGRLTAEGQSVSPAERVVAGKNIVGPDYFTTLGIPIERGRSFTEADDERSRAVGIVNRRLADLLWSGQDPLGRRFSQAGPDGPWIEVIGVTPTGKYRFLFEDLQPYYYVPVAQEYTAMRVLHVRTTARPEGLAAAVEREIHRIQPDLPLYDVETMEEALNGGYGLFMVRTGALFAAALAFMGLSLAVIGLYGVVSQLANERTHEYGIRIALGANRKDIALAVVGSGAVLLLCGTGIGVTVAFGLTRFLSRFLFGLPPVDWPSFAAAIVSVTVVTLIAMFVPARRATTVDPILALRSE